MPGSIYFTVVPSPVERDRAGNFKQGNSNNFCAKLVGQPCLPVFGLTPSFAEMITKLPYFHCVYIRNIVLASKVIRDHLSWSQV